MSIRKSAGMVKTAPPEVLAWKKVQRRKLLSHLTSGELTDLAREVGGWTHSYAPKRYESLELIVPRWTDAVKDRVFEIIGDKVT